MKTALSLALILMPALALASPLEKEAKLGRKVESFSLRDYRGAARSLQDFSDSQLVVITFMGTECPVAKLYGPRLAQLAKEFGPKGVAFVGINSNLQDSVTAIGE